MAVDGRGVQVHGCEHLADEVEMCGGQCMLDLKLVCVEMMTCRHHCLAVSDCKYIIELVDKQHGLNVALVQ